MFLWAACCQVHLFYVKVVTASVICLYTYLKGYMYLTSFTANINLYIVMHCRQFNLVVAGFLFKASVLNILNVNE